MLSLGSPIDNKSESSSPGGNAFQRKNILAGKRPGVGSMLSQFRSYSQSKKSPVLSQRPSVFCSPDDDDEEEEIDVSEFLNMKGKSKPVCFRSTLDNKRGWTFRVIAYLLQGQN